MEKQLPVCRNDIKFSSTIYPHLVTYDNFRYIHEFIRLIPGFEDIHAEGLTVLEFQTQYTLEHTLYGENHLSFPDARVSLDSLQILETDQKRILLCPRILMFSTPSPEELERQMETQREILDLIQSDYDIDEIVHFLIMPRESRTSIYTEFSCPVVTWQQARDCALRILPKGDYWLNQLITALEYRKQLCLLQEKPAAEPAYYLRVTGLQGLLPFERSGMFVGFHGGMNKLQFQRHYNPHYLCHEKSYRLDKTKRSSHWLPIDVIIKGLKCAEEVKTNAS